MREWNWRIRPVPAVTACGLVLGTILCGLVGTDAYSDGAPASRSDLRTPSLVTAQSRPGLPSGGASGRAAPAAPLPPVAWEPTGPRVTWRGVSFIVPPGLTGSDKGAVYDMTGRGVSGLLGQCSLLILQEQPAQGDLAGQAISILVAALAQVGVSVADSRGGSDLLGERRVGRSADGWSYVDVGGMLTEGTGGRARLLLVAHGATVLPLIGMAVQGNGCVGLTFEATPNGNNITWAALYYSLKLSGAAPSSHLREQIVGRWDRFSMSGNVGAFQSEAFAFNGQYTRADTLGVLLPTEAQLQAATYSGNGRYVVEGDKLTIWPNTRPPEARLIRIVEDFEPTTPPKKTRQLCRVNIDPAQKLLPYEFCLRHLSP